jgi:RNA-dependent RNA polymerase
MTSFFVTHMKHDNLRPIAVAHKYWADYCEEGVKDPKCIELAQLHSMAVDYAKTGVPAVMPKRLRVKQWPHWAEVKNKPPSKIYDSKKIIGKLYNMVQRINFIPAWDSPFDKRILDAYLLDEDILAAAAEVKVEYDASVRQLMAKFGIKSDFEVYTTFALEHSDDFGDYKFAETLGEVVGAMKDHLQKICYEKAGTTDKERDWDKMGPFIAAMYTVTAHQVEAAVAQTKKQVLKAGLWLPLKEPTLESMPFMSFPWLFAPELGRIARERNTGAEDSIAAHALPALRRQKPKSAFRAVDEWMPEPLQEVEMPSTERTVSTALLAASFNEPAFTQPVRRSEDTGVASAPQENIHVDERIGSGLVQLEDLNGLTSEESSGLPAFPPEASNMEDTSVPAAEDSNGEDGEEAEAATITLDNKPSKLDALESMMGM